MLTNNIIDYFKSKLDFNNSILEDSKRQLFSNIKSLEKLDSFIGQEILVNLLKMSLIAANKASKPLEHICIFGPPGYGKSKLAELVANEYNAIIKSFIGTDLKDKKNIDELINFLKVKTGNKKIVFIDEIHNIPIKTAEKLYEAVQDFKIDSEIIEPFTLICATTTSGKIPKPLYDRITYKIKMDKYSQEDIVKIVTKTFDFDEDLALFIAKRSKLIPRIAIQYSKMIKDAAIYDDSEPTLRHGSFIMNMLQINSDGLSATDILILQLLKLTPNLSKQTICSSLKIDLDEYSSNIEPYLLSLNLIQISSKGRNLTLLGRQYIQNIKTD